MRGKKKGKRKGKAKGRGSVGRGQEKEKKTDRRRSGCVRKKKMNPKPCPAVGLSFIPSKTRFFGWCIHWWVKWTSTHNRP